MGDYNKKFRFNKDVHEYDFKIRNLKWLWWLLLLLIIPLMFIRFNKTITVTCLEQDSDEPIAFTPAALHYSDYSLLNDGEWFASQSVVRDTITDSCGRAVFRGLRCGVFGFVFHAMTKADFSLESECYSKAFKSFNIRDTLRAVADAQTLETYFAQQQTHEDNYYSSSSSRFAAREFCTRL